MDSDPVNHSWLCDKGRYGHEAVNAEDRLAEPLVRRSGSGATDELVPASWAEALTTVAQRLRAVRDEHGPGAIGVLGGARLGNEDAYAWAKLAKGVLGTDSVDAQLGDGLPAELVLGLPRATVDEACAARAVVVLSGDRRVDASKLSKLAREELRVAKPDEVRDRTGFPIGGVPPFPHVEGVKVYPDSSLMRFEQVWAAAGTPNAVFRIGTSDLVRLVGEGTFEVSAQMERL